MMSNSKLTEKEIKKLARKASYMVQLDRVFTFLKTPMMFLSGSKLTTLDAYQATSTIRYNRLNQNPFRSTYFAALSMAAELPATALALLHTKSVGDIEVSIRYIKSHFSKKAVGITTFTCTNGLDMFYAVKQIEQEQKKEIEVATVSIGKNKQGKEVCRYDIIWIFTKK